MKSREMKSCNDCGTVIESPLSERLWKLRLPQQLKNELIGCFVRKDLGELRSLYRSLLDGTDVEKDEFVCHNCLLSMLVKNHDDSVATLRRIMNDAWGEPKVTR